MNALVTIKNFYHQNSRVINISLFIALSALILWRVKKVLFVGFDDFVSIIFDNEGGYVNNPKDPGGETKYGISKRSYPNLNIPNITKAQAKEIYKKDFYEPLNIEGLKSDNLKLQIFDHAVNAGKNEAIELLQKLVKAPVTGKTNQDLIKRANAYTTVGTDLSKYYKDIRKAAYMAKTNYPTFGKGWFNRVDNTNLPWI